jgi:DNA-binding MarR family transcriptional regulator
MYGISVSEVPITGLVWRLSMRWQAAVNRVVTPLGITAAQYAVLVPLRNLEQAGRRPNQRELAAHTGLESLYVSKLARGLEGAGLVSRATDPADSRSVRLALTDEGRAVVATAVERVVALQEELLAPLGGLEGRAAGDLRAALVTLLGTDQRE